MSANRHADAPANTRHRLAPGDAALPDMQGSDETTRVRLGSSTQAPQAILEALANDPSVTVRAAVAMNTRAPARIDEQLARDGDERVRSLLARKLASLVPGLSGTARGALQQRAYNTLVQLANDEAVRVRATIADMLQSMPNAPRELILRLAHDTAVPVSDPVIRLSPLLTPEDLLALITVPPTPATAVSIANRPGLNEDVAEAIANTANVAAITALLSNKSAAIREATLDALIDRASAHTEWHEPLVHRPILPARAARALAEFVTSDLLRALTERTDLDPCITQEITQRLAQSLAAHDTPRRLAPDMNGTQALAAARALAAENQLTEAVILAAAQRGETRFTAALLAVAADLPLALVDRAGALRSAKGIVSLVWRAGFSMRIATPMQALLARLPPPAILPAGPGGSFPLAVDEMRWQLDFLARPGG